MKAYVEKGRKGIKPKHMEKVVKKAKDINEKADKLDPTRYSGLIGRVRLFISLVQDYWNKKYTDIPWISMAAVVFALLYFLSPIDLIPDVIPVIGYLDDAAVFSIVVAAISDDLKKYKEWKTSS